MREYTKRLQEWEAIPNNPAKRPELQLSLELSVIFQELTEARAKNMALQEIQDRLKEGNESVCNESRDDSG